MTKYIFVTGGVLSSLGKGITSASVAALLKHSGFDVSMLKIDPYLNVDPGTMSPLEHGEVYVTADGGETDLDLGHYERFLGKSLEKMNNMTTGQVYSSVIKREREGGYLGKTIQVIPHIVDEIKDRIYAAGKGHEFLIVELGGTVGDIEGLPFMEAVREIRHENPKNKVMNIHVTLVPYIKAAGELKTKPTQHSVQELRRIGIMPHMLVAAIILMVVYFILDTYYYKKEGAKAPDDGEKKPLRLVGTYNFLFLGGVVGAVLMSGILDLGEISTFGVHRAVQDWLRDGLLIVFGIGSLMATPRVLREENEFSWFPIIEVAYLFIGIFITMIPCLLLLKAGPNGAFAFLINAVKEPVHYFWVTGMLSAFLDNAPTYLTFFNTALGSFYAGMAESQAVPLLMTENAVYLKAISTGAVFFGACSYIGNAPNFMVRSIASEAGTPMPSFFGYILKYSLIFLIPTFVIVTFIFF